MPQLGAVLGLVNLPGHCPVFADCSLFSGVVNHHKNQKSFKIGELCLKEERDVGGEAGEVAER